MDIGRSEERLATRMCQVFRQVRSRHGIGGQMRRRRFIALLGLGGTAALAPAVLRAGHAADAYPNRPIKIIVPAAPGGPNDDPARMAVQILPPKLGQPVVVEHRPGAGGAIGTREVAKAAPDGYTLLSAGTGMLAVTPVLSASAGYDPTRDFAPVAEFMEGFHVLVVHPSSPWQSVRDLIDDARANPGKINFAHTGTGNLPHLSAELFMSRAGVSLVGVPYRSGGESVTAVLGQAVHMAFDNVTLLLPLVAEGKLRALAVTSPARSALAPALPTMMEAGVPDYDVTTFFGIAAPAGTSPAIVNTLNTAIVEALNTPQMQQTIARLGAVARPGSPSDFAAVIAAHAKKWAALGKAANIKID
jgi:tripartite-type tricarboxylate transporter receptor subunit TctC